MRAIPYILIVLLALTTTAAVVTRPKDAPAVVVPSLAERIHSACKPLPINDFWIDPDDHTLIHVSCYDPKTSKLFYTVVDR